MIKKILIRSVVILLIFGCAATSTNNILDISPNIYLPQQDPSLMGITVSVNSKDQRQNQSLAKVNRAGHLLTMIPSRDLRFLLQEVMEKQMTARGYMIGPNSTVDLHIVINNFFANISEGSLRYNITTWANISIIAQAKNGNKQVKNYKSMYNVQGMFHATNSKIANAFNKLLTDIIINMANDSNLNSFIKQNSRII